MAIKIIKNLVDVWEFAEGAIMRPDNPAEALADGVLLVSNGEDGNNELQNYFSTQVRPGETHAFVQLSETPVNETGRMNEMVQVRASVILAKKLAETKVTNIVRITHGDEVWQKMLKLMGRFKLAGEYYATRTDELVDEAYDCTLHVDGMMSPVKRIANAIVVGWYFEFEVEFSVNDLMYGS